MCCTCGSVLAYQSNSIDDSRGNNDGNMDPGEQNIHMEVVVWNSGSVSATNITGTLTSPSSDVIITQASSSYPSIPSNGTAQNDYDFVFDVATTASCGKNLLFQLSMDTLQGKFVVPFEVPVGTATVLMTADFDHGLPSGWSIIGNANGKTWNWIDSCLRTEFPSPYMIVDSSCAGSTAMNEQLITNIIDATNAASFILTFDHAYYQKGAEKADVDVKIDGEAGLMLQNIPPILMFPFLLILQARQQAPAMCRLDSIIIMERMHTGGRWIM